MSKNWCRELHAKMNASGNMAKLVEPRLIPYYMILDWDPMQEQLDGAGER